jgi:hypothetical protein
VADWLRTNLKLGKGELVLGLRIALARLSARLLEQAVHEHVVPHTNTGGSAIGLSANGGWIGASAGDDPFWTRRVKKSVG